MFHEILRKDVLIPVHALIKRKSHVACVVREVQGMSVSSCTCRAMRYSLRDHTRSITPIVGVVGTQKDAGHACRVSLHKCALVVDSLVCGEVWSMVPSDIKLLEARQKTRMVFIRRVEVEIKSVCCASHDSASPKLCT